MSIYRRGARGFTLVEIMIVVAIIALIAAIAIPNLLRARHNANETAAIGNLKTIVDAVESFRANGTKYPATLAALHSADPPYLDDVLGKDPATRSGYTFTYDTTSDNTYTTTAEPVDVKVTGTRYFFVNQTGVIRWKSGSAADKDSAPLE